MVAEDVIEGAGLSIVITDDRAVRDLNRRFLGPDEPTDVLSFPMKEERPFVTSSAGARQLGDVVIAFPTAARQAGRAGHSVDDELAHLLVHGILHILGYDHERPGQERRMRAREDELLGRAAH